MKTFKPVLTVLGFCFISLTFFGQNVRCSLLSLPSVTFKLKSTKLSSNNMEILNAAAELLRVNPGCKVKLLGYGASNKDEQQRSWDRVNNVKHYLNEIKGISETRFIFMYGQEGNNALVDLVPTTEDGPNTTPPPHPNLRKDIDFKSNGN